MDGTNRTGVGRSTGSPSVRRRRQRGFTLIELGVVLAVLAILVAVAVPTYLRMVARAREAEAQQGWSMVKAELWSYYLQHNSFPELNNNWPNEVDQPTVPNWSFTAQMIGDDITVVASPTSQNTNGETLCWTLTTDGTVDADRGSNCP